jgi:anti-anti-sigma factor
MAWTSLHPTLIADMDDRDGVGSAVVRLAGELDHDSAGHARRWFEVVLDTRRQLVIDVSRVTFCDSAGVRLLEQVIGNHDGPVAIGHLHHSVRRAFQVSGSLAAAAVTRRTPVTRWVDLVGPATAVLADAVDVAVRATGATAGNAQLLDPASGELRIVAHQGFEPPFLDFFQVVHDSDSACGTALRDRKLVAVSDVARSPIFADSPALDVMIDARARAVMSAPVLGDEGEVLAVISTHFPRITRWHPHHRRSLRHIAARAGAQLA